VGSGANLSGADLTATALAPHSEKVSIFLTQPDLQQQALLREATKRGADLSGANLSEASGISYKRLERQAASLKDATMPNGQKYEDWLKDKESRKEDGKNDDHT
jgi:uncharacterized protein YjbI with pentapeptide repeats